MVTAAAPQGGGDSEWLDELVGRQVAAARAAVERTTGARQAWVEMGKVVAHAARLVTTGHELAGGAVRAAEAGRVTAAGVWFVWWQKVRPRLQRHTRLILGGGVSVCGLALVLMFWPKGAVTAADRKPADPATVAPSRTTLQKRQDAEGEVCKHLTAREWDEAERACEGLTGGRRYLLLGECERGRGHEDKARFFYRRATECGDELGALALKAKR